MTCIAWKNSTEPEVTPRAIDWQNAAPTERMPSALDGENHEDGHAVTLVRRKCVAAAVFDDNDANSNTDDSPGGVSFALSDNVSRRP